MHRSYLITSALIFAAVAILHFPAPGQRLDLCTGSWSIPRWVSMGWDGASSMVVCLGTFSGIEKVAS